MTSNFTEPRPRSILDNDLYKFTMQQAVLHNYPNATVSYSLTNRNESIPLNAKAVEWLEEQIAALSTLYLTPAEHTYLATQPFFTPDYLDYLLAFRFDPSSQVAITFDPSTNHLSLTIHGLWREVILYEVPLLALVSESRFLHVDKEWTRDGQKERAKEKARELLEGGCAFSEFGTRRRRDFETQDVVIEGLVEAEREWRERGAVGHGALTGTSNVYFAMKYKIGVVGTVAHEFIMAISALTGVLHANRIAYQLWLSEFHNRLAIALTDTFGTAAFFRDFDAPLARTYSGVRHDSGDPRVFTERVVDHYRSLSIDPRDKTIVFSDGLDVARAVQLKKFCDGVGIGCAFGIGTFFTNDFERVGGGKSHPMNIVIKMRECNGKAVVKLSDELGKRSGEENALKKVLEELGI